MNSFLQSRLVHITDESSIDTLQPLQVVLRKNGGYTVFEKKEKIDGQPERFHFYFGSVVGNDQVIHQVEPRDALNAGGDMICISRSGVGEWKRLTPADGERYHTKYSDLSALGLMR